MILTLDLNNKIKVSLHNNISTWFEIADITLDTEIMIDVALHIYELFESIAKKPEWANSEDNLKELQRNIMKYFWEVEDKYSITIDEGIITSIVNMVKHYEL